MRLLDLFCGAGGATAGYQAAGFTVVGVDIKPQPHYCGDKFYQMDALDALAWIDDFDAVHASPPCQAFSLASGANRRRKDHPNLIPPVRDALRAANAYYVIENVPQAPLIDPVTLCGSTFGLPVLRHRSFECSFPVRPMPCGYAPTARCAHKGYLAYPYARKTWEPAWEKHVLPVVWPWMTTREAGQAIPPAYTRYLGYELTRHMEIAA